jgi:hypothetical protein
VSLPKVPPEAAAAFGAMAGSLAGLPPALAGQVAGTLAEIANAIASSPEPASAAERIAVMVQAKIAFRAGGAALSKAKKP